MTEIERRLLLEPSNLIVRYFWYLLPGFFLLVGILNSNSNLMGGILGYYFDFVRIIEAGFDPLVAELGRPTFPMWGYAWLLLITENRYTIFATQALFAFLAVVIFLTFTERSLRLVLYSKAMLRTLILLSTSWIAVHFTLSPYSFSISLILMFTVAFCLSIQSTVRHRSLFFTFIAALLAGIMLNLRSDYVYFFVACSFLYIYFNKSLILSVLQVGCFVLIVGLMLSPWMLYTNKVNGTPMITSTNSGHVLYIGLGHLPGNVWGITTEDGDLQMNEDLRRAGMRDSLSYEGDKYLKSRFLELVVSDPGEYSKKIAFSSLKTVFSGIYVPEFYSTNADCYRHHSNVRKDLELRYSVDDCRNEFLREVMNRPLAALIDSPQKFMIYLLSYLSILGGVVFLLIGFIALPFAFFIGWRQMNVLIIISSLIFFYQFLINSLAFQMKLYSTFSYLSGLILIVFVFDQFYKKYHDQKT